MLVSLSTMAQIAILDRVIAIVDDDVVLQSELDQRLATIYTQIQQSGTTAPPQDILVQQVLERLISERLQLTIGYNAGIRISDEELKGTLTASDDQMIALQWKAREPKPVGKGKHTVTKDAKVSYDEIKKATVQIQFNK